MERIGEYTAGTFMVLLTTVVKSDQEETLGTVLSLVFTSHGAIFVFDKQDTFLGLVSPHQVLYKHRYPYTTKIGSIVFRPPHITGNTTLFELVNAMISTRIYMLPVFTKDGMVEGVVHAKDIFQAILDNPDFLTAIAQIIEPKMPVTAHIQSTVSQVYTLMKEKNVSRVVLVDDEEGVAGIISRSDVMRAFIHPTPKQRFSKESGDSGYFAFDEEEVYRRDDPVKKFYTDMVETLLEDTQTEQIIRKLITSSRNSIVLVNRNNKPIGFLSLRDILEAITRLQPQETIPINIKKPSDAVSNAEQEKATEHLYRFVYKMHKRMTIEKVEVHCDESKYPTGEPAEFTLTVVFTPVAGEKIIAKTQEKTFLDSMQRATEQIEKQERRRGLSREKTKYTHI